ncbi:MAG: site-specific integrase [Sphingobacteriaceae bacterium]|nr:site-specific integrase [Sphingobacteriaceae bacterium]
MRWSKTMNCWYLPFYKNIIQDLFLLSKNNYYLDYSEFKAKAVESPRTQIIEEESVEALIKQDELQKLSEETIHKIEEFKFWLKSKRYSHNTIDTYTETLKTFLRFYAQKALSDITNDDLILFNNHYILAKSFSASYQNQIVNSVKLFFLKVENKKLNPELIHRPKRPKLLPNVLSMEEVKLILNAHNNTKHKVMLSLIYSCGLRCGELLRLKPEHVDSKRNVLIIRQSKGRKDRIAPLSHKIIVMLRDYFAVCKPKTYLFEGQTPGEPYDERSLQNVLKQALAKVNIIKPVSLHWLRHSYATHLLEVRNRFKVHTEILGHSSSKTTEIYTRKHKKHSENSISFDYL